VNVPPDEMPPTQTKAIVFDGVRCAAGWGRQEEESRAAANSKVEETSGDRLKRLLRDGAVAVGVENGLPRR